jgi:hypothetical protein
MECGKGVAGVSVASGLALQAVIPIMARNIKKMNFFNLSSLGFPTFF